jgi:hypothetical protein
MLVYLVGMFWACTTHLPEYMGPHDVNVELEGNSAVNIPS